MSEAPATSTMVHVAPLTDAAVAALGVLTGTLGLGFIRVDLAGCVTKAELMARMARDMAFPDWFGGNWDALADCLADLSWRPARGHVIVLDHASALLRAEPDTLSTVVEVLADAAAEHAARGQVLRAFVDASVASAPAVVAGGSGRVPQRRE